jgi:cell division septation protein DedD
MKREKETGKSFLSGKKGGVIFIIGSLLSIGLFFAFAQIVDFVIKKTEAEQPRTHLPFADQPAPSAHSASPDDSRAEDASPKLGFYTSLTRTDEPPERLTLNNQKPEAKKPAQEKQVSLPKPQEEQQINVDKKSLPAEPASASIYYLQLGAFQQTAKAEALLNELRSAGYRPHTDTITVQGKGKLIRVRIGPVQDLSAARTIATDIEKKTKRTVGITKK